MAIERKFYVLEVILLVRESKIDNKIIRLQNIFPVFLHQTLSVLCAMSIVCALCALCALYAVCTVCVVCDALCVVCALCVLLCLFCV